MKVELLRGQKRFSPPVKYRTERTDRPRARAWSFGARGKMYMSYTSWNSRVTQLLKARAGVSRV